MLVPDLVRLRILRAEDLTLSGKKKKLKCKIYGASKTIYSQSADANDSKVLWDSDMTIKMQAPSEDVKIVISDDKNNHYGQILMSKHEILARQEGTSSNLLVERSLEPTSKVKNVTGRIYFWIWAASKREEDSLGHAESHNSLNSVGSKFKTDKGSNFSLNKLKIDIKNPKIKFKSLGSHLRSNIDLSSNFSKNSFDSGSIQDLHSSIVPKTPHSPNSNYDEDSFIFEKELPTISMGEIHEDVKEEGPIPTTVRVSHKASALSNDPKRRPKIVGIEPLYGPTTGNYNVDIFFENLEECDLEGSVLLIGDSFHKDWKYSKNKRNVISVNFPKSMRENQTWDCKIAFDFIKFGTVTCPKPFKYQAIEEQRAAPKLITSMNSIKRIREDDTRSRKDSDMSSTLNSLAQSMDRDTSDMRSAHMEPMNSRKSDVISKEKSETPISTNSSMNEKSFEKETNSHNDIYSEQDVVSRTSSRRNSENDDHTESERAYSDEEKSESNEEERSESVEEEKEDSCDEVEETKNIYNKKGQAYPQPIVNRAPMLNEKMKMNRTNIFSSFEKDFIENQNPTTQIPKSPRVEHPKRNDVLDRKMFSSPEIKSLTETLIENVLGDATEQFSKGSIPTTPLVSNNRTLRKTNDLVPRTNEKEEGRAAKMAIKSDRPIRSNDKRNLSRKTSPIGGHAVIPVIKVENFGSLPKDLNRDSNRMNYYEPKKPINQVVPTKIDKTIKNDAKGLSNEDDKKQKMTYNGEKNISDADVKVEKVIDDLKKENKQLKKTINALNEDVDRISLDLCKLRIRILENGPIELLEKQCSLEMNEFGAEMLKKYSNNVKLLQEMKR